MVRFKNRHILVEFLQPHILDPSFTNPPPATIGGDLDGDEDEDMDGGEDDGVDDDEEVLQRIPEVPFLLPLPSQINGGEGLQLGDEGGGTIYKAVRTIVQDVYGDEGWGRIASSFKVVYYSKFTTLTILRIARPHYRLLWSSITLMTTLNGQRVLPRVVAISGTIKKLQNAAIVYHRGITARLLTVALDSKTSSSEKQEEKKRLDTMWESERSQIASLED